MAEPGVHGDPPGGHHARVVPLAKWGPGAFFALDVLYAVVLAVLLIARPAHWLWVDHIKDPIGGVVPIGVPWFGALGGLTISIYGIVDHLNDWQPRWTLWHAIRPLVGAILGTVAYLIFIGVIQATGTSPTLGTANHSQPINSVVYLVIAFVVGYREETFRSLIKRVVDILLSPGDQTNAPSVSITPAPVDFGQVAHGTTSQPKTVTITNTGTAPLVFKGSADNPPGIAVQNEVFAIVTDPLTGATINPGASGNLTIEFSPAAVGDQQGTLSVASNAGTFPVVLKGSGG